MISIFLDWWNGPCARHHPRCRLRMFCAIVRGHGCCRCSPDGFGFGIIIFNTTMLFVGAYLAQCLLTPGLDLPLRL